MLAQKRNKIMYKNMFSNFFKFPIGHLTHPPTSKVFLDFFIFFLFTWPLSDDHDEKHLLCIILNAKSSSNLVPRWRNILNIDHAGVAWDKDHF